MTDYNPKANGLTQKELSLLILEGQDKINERIDQLHEKVNQKISRAELSGWLVAVSALVVLIQAVMQSTTQGGNSDRNNISINNLTYIIRSFSLARYNE